MLIGVLLGLITSLVIFQVFAVASADSRTAGSVVNTQAAGSIAVYRLENDIKHAGFGIGRLSSDVTGCAVAGVDSNGAFTFAFQPVVIADGTSGAPDQLTVLIGSSPMHTDRTLFDNANQTSHTKTLRSRAGFSQGDLVIGLGTGVSPLQCALMQVSKLATSSLDILHAPSGAYSRFNPNPSVDLGTTGEIANLGPQPQLSTWSVSSNRLVVANRFAASINAVEVLDDVLDFQAQYGYDANNDKSIGDDEWYDTAPAGVDWNRVRAVRIAILLRGQNMESADVAQSTPRWQAAGRDFTMSGTDWRRYRYRVYEDSIAMRNVIWTR